MIMASTPVGLMCEISIFAGPQGTFSASLTLGLLHLYANKTSNKHKQASKPQPCRTLYTVHVQFASDSYQRVKATSCILVAFSCGRSPNLSLQMTPVISCYHSATSTTMFLCPLAGHFGSGYVMFLNLWWAQRPFATGKRGRILSWPTQNFDGYDG